MPEGMSSQALLEEIQSIIPDTNQSKIPGGDLANELSHSETIVQETPLEQYFSEIERLNAQKEDLFKKAKEGERKKWDELWDNACNSIYNLKINLLGDNLTLKYKIGESQDELENKENQVQKNVKEKLAVISLSKENINDIDKLLLISSFRSNYIDRVRKYYSGEDILNMDYCDDYEEIFGIYPEYTAAIFLKEEDCFISEPSYFGSPEKTILDIAGLDIYRYEGTGDINTEQIKALLPSLSPEAGKRLSELLQGSYLDAKNAIKAVRYNEESYYSANRSLEMTVANLDVAKLEMFAQEVIPIIGIALKESTFKDERLLMRDQIRFLGEIDCEDVITGLLISTELTYQERLSYIAEIMNVYGFMPAINMVKRQASEDSLSENIKLELKKAFHELQGEEDEIDIQQNLSDVYQKVNFHEYALNNMELTRAEVSKIQEQVDIFARLNEIDPKDVLIIDIGAGTGRHSLLLTELGQKRVVAFEYEPAHTAKINEQAEERDLDLVAVQGDWNMMNEILNKAGIEKFEVAVVLNRTIMHNNTPDAMLHWWDELSQVLGEGYDGVMPRVIVDIPDIREGQYLEKTLKIRRSLEKHGVEDFVTMHLFDGPNDQYKFNRLALTEDQFRAYAYLFGFSVVSKRSEILGENHDIKNDYYVLEKKPNFNPGNISADEMHKYYENLGVTGLGINWDMKIKSWRVSIKEAKMWGHMYIAWSDENEKEKKALYGNRE